MGRGVHIAVGVLRRTSVAGEIDSLASVDRTHVATIVAVDPPDESRPTIDDYSTDVRTIVTATLRVRIVRIAGIAGVVRITVVAGIPGIVGKTGVVVRIAGVVRIARILRILHVLWRRHEGAR